MTDDIGNALKFDPLIQAEVMTGKSYKEDPETSQLGFDIHLSHVQNKRKLLEENNDTHYSSDFATQLAVFMDLGFEVVLTDPFKGSGYNEGEVWDETYLVLWHPLGVLADMESYQVTHRNTAKMWYNIRFNDEVDRWRMIGSGRLREDNVWVGDHDTREGLRYHFNQLKDNGTFLNPWAERPFLWLLTYMESKVEGYDYKAITAERLSRLPKHVQDAIGSKSLYD